MYKCEGKYHLFVPSYCIYNSQTSTVTSSIRFKPGVIIDIIEISEIGNIITIAC